MCAEENEQHICGTCRCWEYEQKDAASRAPCIRFPQVVMKHETLGRCEEWKSRKEKQILHESKE